MRRNYSNTAVATTLSAAILAGDASLSVTDATGYPDAPFTITVEGEVMLVGAKAGLTFSSLTRAYDGTAAAGHASGAAVTHVGVALDIERAWGTRLPLMSGGHYPNVLGGTGTYKSRGVGHLALMPLVVPDSATLDRIGVNCSTAGAGSLARLGLYRDNGSGKPGSLLLQAGTVDLSTTGNKTIVINQVLRPGIYWVACLIEGAAATLEHATGSATFEGFPTSDFWIDPRNGFTAGAVAAGALPANAPALSLEYETIITLVRVQ